MLSRHGLSKFSHPTPALIGVPVLDQHIVGDGDGAPHLKGTVPDAALEGQSGLKPCSADGGLAIANIAEGQERKVLIKRPARQRRNPAPILKGNKTRQGYAPRSTLKPAGYFFEGGLR